MKNYFTKEEKTALAEIITNLKPKHIIDSLKMITEMTELVKETNQLLWDEFDRRMKENEIFLTEKKT